MMLGAGACLILAGLLVLGLVFSQPEEAPSRRGQRRAAAREAEQNDPLARETRYFSRGNLTMVWDRIKPDVMAQVRPVSTTSNIAPPDYSGPQACADCHQENFAQWSQHPHRWMNAVANQQSVLGDFSGQAQLNYRGGVATFFERSGQLRMRYERGDYEREYVITQTIGSRFYQYYVGKGVVGPEPADHDYYNQDFVLPFGYWLQRKTWVPIVHIADEAPEGQRWESIEQLKPPANQTAEEGVGRSRGVVDHTSQVGLMYARACNYCHTTFPLGEMFVRNPKLIGPSLTQRSLFGLSDYVSQSHPELWDGSQRPELLSSNDLDALTGAFISFDARDEATTLGISCEACHLGCQEHVREPETPPSFAPQSPHLLVFTDPHTLATHNTPENVNAACARCHVGNRPTYAGGMSTWNSTEYTDAMRGGCYSQLSCIHCHDPHQATGLTWPKTPEQDDASCLSCHRQYGQPDFRLQHTHHPAGSAGDRCMNCHMPRINEGMQDVVRTHTIFSPTQPDMIHANHPNACNLCHLERNILWTLRYLRDWYGREYAAELVTQNYPDLEQPVGLSWLQHPFESTRLVAAEAMSRQNSRWALRSLVELLDDPFLLNRQFTQQSVERLLNLELDEAVGYWYYMTASERLEPLAELKRRLAELETAAGAK